MTTTTHLTSKEVAEALDIFPQQVPRYARRCGVKRAPKGWPAKLVDLIRADRAGPDRKQGAIADELMEQDGMVLVMQRRSDGRRRVLARIPTILLAAAKR